MNPLREIAAAIIVITVFVILLIEVVKKVREERRDIKTREWDDARGPDWDGW